MEFIQVLHMNGGEGETSYAKNSVVQRKIMSFGNPVIGDAVADVVCNLSPECMAVADLGCSSGPNTLMLVSEIIDIVYYTCRKMGKSMPELSVCLNDLPGVPGSFYGRLFPRKSMHFIHSSSSLHWLSQAPPSLDSDPSKPLNKGKLYISKTSPMSVRNAYLLQFQKDFSAFLKSRSEEMVSGGRMVLSFLGRISPDPSTEESCYQWELLAQALAGMVSEDNLLEKKIDSFNAPYYAPSLEEVKTAVEEEGSFAIDCLEAFEIDWDVGFHNDSLSEKQEGKLERSSRGQKVAKTIRAVVESMLESHFGEELNMDGLFMKYADLVDDYFSKGRPIYINLVMSFTRNGSR